MKKLIFVLVIAALCITAYSPVLMAAERGYELKAGSVSIKEVLLENTGKRVILKMEAGEAIEGTVTRVGDSVVHISKIAGREFFDAVVRIDKISAVIFRVRG